MAFPGGKSLREMRLDSVHAVLKEKGPMRASDLGWALWGENEQGGGEGSHRQNKYCRAAGKALHALERSKRAFRTHKEKYTLWTAI